MNFIIQGHEYDYDVQTIVQVFYPNEKYTQLSLNELETINNGMIAFSRINVDENNCCAAIFESGLKIAEKIMPINDYSQKELRRLIKISLYHCLSQITGYQPSWGALTGIRPAKRIHDCIKAGISYEDIFLLLQRDFLVQENKARLAIEVAQAEHDILKENDGNSISIYAGIPFCPTRCLYCSFTSYPIQKYAVKASSYLDCLIKELEFIKGYCHGKYIENIYIGGGTPTSLNYSLLEKLLAYISTQFDISGVKEFSVEAGRPDTIDTQKLKLLKQYGVNRISVNPQTMNQKTLDTIGRKHTVQEFIAAYQAAVEIGFENINVDLILGLPNEHPDDVRHTMEELFKLSPSSVTVHTLAIKRAADLKLHMGDYTLADRNEMEQMLEIASEYCRKNSLFPYYMYRQKNATGNFENIGYAKKGLACMYNVQIMEEQQSILAAGAGAVTKLVDLSANRIERIFNVKNVDEYISRVDEMIDRKMKGVTI